MTSLFCDLVGFTASSERMDPEDVDKVLAAYAAMAQAKIESHGGLVEKFIGDAVVGIFGAPTAHEDDPERAVRAGLRIVEGAEALWAAGETPLRLRIGINTGEALVRLAASVARGERLLAGDSVNTASRLQSVAPEMGVAVGLATYEATRAVFEYEELDIASLKGKSDPVRVFHAKAARAHFGTDLTRTHDGPFIGREIDLALLKGSFDKTVAAGSVQLVTVVGEPGLGKSRLVAELFAYIDARPELTTWRQGRCLPYGEGITFWALGEIVKAQAGILESDSPARAEAKLDVVLPEGSEREWFRQRLLPLLGIDASSSAEREELFTAWRRFLEHIAEERPTVLVFEDLHWADEPMLAFLEHLADLAEGVPLLLVGTARPELFERRAGYAAGLRNANTINLEPLLREETARLVSALLDATVLPVELQQPILDRAGGNPLYAEEFVRLLKDRDLLVRKGGTWELAEGAAVPLPESVQALLTARLDTLEPDAKSLLGDAAVIGNVFWAGALAEMGGRDLQQVTTALRELSRKELVRPVRRSSIEGEAEHAFWHILARDVAYGQLPRVSRASRHVAAARWIESKAPGRVEDLADVLAHHYATALDLARAGGETELATELEEPARRFLGLAGERALDLDTPAALARFGEALTLTPIGHPGRARALAQFGAAARDAGRNVEAKAALETAIEGFKAVGDVPGTARAMRTLSHVLSRVGDPSSWTLTLEALALLEPLPPSADLVEVLSDAASGEVLILDGRLEVGLDYAERALALADELGLEPPARALGFRGLARVDLGDPAGLEDMRESIVLATEAGQGVGVTSLSNNLAVSLMAFEGPLASLEVFEGAVAFAESRGLAGWVRTVTTSMLDPLFDSGRLDAALELSAELTVRLGGEERWDLGWIRAIEARALTLRGHAAQVAGTLDWLESTIRDTGSSQHIVFGLSAAAIARAALGESASAGLLLAEIESAPEARENQYYPAALPAMVRAALVIGDLSLAERLTAGVEPHSPQARHAMLTVGAALAEAAGDLVAAADGYTAAAERWRRFDAVPEQGFALLGQGRCLAGLGRPAEATIALRQAREIFAALEAAPALAEADALLRRVSALSA